MLAIVLGVVAVIAVLSAVIEPADRSDKEPATFADPAKNSTTSAPQEVIAPAGTAVRDGKFEFEVLSFTASRNAGDRNNPYAQSAAQGVYYVIEMRVTNIGDEPQAFFGSNQKLYDVSGRSYGNDPVAEGWVNNHITNITINPGNSLTPRVIFDVPEGTAASFIEVHDSAFSGGEMVYLPKPS